MMKKFLICLLACAAVASASTANATVIYGYQAFEPLPDPKRGPVYFDTSDVSKFTFLADNTDESIIYAGYYLNYHWYGQAIVRGTQSSVEGMFDIDMTTGKRTLIKKGGMKLIDMTVDYSTGDIYGIRNGSRILGKFDPATGENSAIGIFNHNGSEIYMIAIAADLDGTLYGVSTDDRLFKISKTDAALTLVGNLEADAAFDQSMEFDHNTGTLYWANNGDYSLYTVDKTTGKATLIGSLGENGVSSMASLFIPYIHVAKGAPDRVTERKAQGAETSVTLTWKNPAVDAQGNALGELKGVKVLRDGKQVADITTDVKAGAAMSYTDKNLASDVVYKYSLVPYNSKGDGGVDGIDIETRTGKDLPAAPGALTATQGDSEVTLTWTAPTAGMNGGSFTPADITGYEIKRGETVLTTVPASQLSYTDKYQFGRYSYTVTAISAAGKGVPATITDVIIKPADWIVMCNGEATIEQGKTYKFYDEGGPNGNYRNELKQTIVLRPAVAGDYVCVNFTKFCIDDYGDYLYVYDGPDTDSRQIGEFASTTLPSGLQNLEATTASGCLTFVFESDLIFAESGWEADVTVRTRAANDLAAESIMARTLVAAESECTYTVTVANKGLNTASDWKVSLLDGDNVIASAAGVSLEPGKSTDIKVVYKPTATGTLNISARVDFDADNNIDNNRTATLAQNVIAAGTTFLSLEAAEDVATTVEIMPMSFMSVQSISEVIVDASKLQSVKNMYLIGISYPLVEVTESYHEVPATIWAGETELADLKDNIVPANQMTLGFDGKFDIAPGMSTIDFFFNKSNVEYKGGNLAIMVHKAISNTNRYGVSFRGDYGYGHTHDNISRFDASFSADDATPFNPNEIFGYGGQNIIPDMILLFSKDNSGVNDAAVDLSGAGIRAVAGGIASDIAAEVYNLAGMRVATLAPGETAALAKGIYVVRTASASVKIAVR